MKRMVKSGNLSSNNYEFIGTFYHSLEAKGRVSVPKVFRDQLSEGSVITRGLDGALFILPSSSWKQLLTKLRSLPITNKAARNFLRLLTYNAAPLQFDSLGRTKIPQPLLDQAGITKDVVFAGALTRVEVWDRDRYHHYLDSLDNLEDQLETSFEELGI